MMVAYGEQAFQQTELNAIHTEELEDRWTEIE